MSSYQYRKSHCGDKTILRPSCLHNGISYTGKTTSLYWIGALVTAITNSWGDLLGVGLSAAICYAHSGTICYPGAISPVFVLRVLPRPWYTVEMPQAPTELIRLATLRTEHTRHTHDILTNTQFLCTCGACKLYVLGTVGVVNVW